MARDTPPYTRRLADLKRKRAERDGCDRILIVTEGSKTEPLYFNEIRSSLKLSEKIIRIHPSTLGTEPRQIVDSARELFVNGDSRRRLPKKAYEKVFVVFDRDSHNTYDNALDYVRTLDGKLRNDAKQSVSFQAIPSVPNFEFWLLLHFEDIQCLISRKEALCRLKKHIPNYEKNMSGSYALTKENLHLAIERSKNLKNQGNAYGGNEPYTEIGLLIKVLLKLKS